MWLPLIKNRVSDVEEEREESTIWRGTKGLSRRVVILDAGSKRVDEARFIRIDQSANLLSV